MKKLTKLLYGLGFATVLGVTTAFTTVSSVDGTADASEATNAKWRLEATDNFAYDGRNVRWLDGKAEIELDPDMVREPKSGRLFPVSLPAGEDFHTLVGTGLRTKTFLKVKVYAFGLYVDVPPATSTLQRWAHWSARELERDDSFYEELLKGHFGMSLRLVMTRDVGGDDMAEAFADALRPRVRHAAEELDMPGGEEALTEFRTYFDVEELTKETELVFSWLPDGRLVTSVQGNVKGEIHSAALSWALFDVYLGEDPISNSGKKSLVSRFPQLLAEAQEQQTPRK